MYVSHYSANTLLRIAEVPTPDDLVARQQAIRAFDLRFLCEAWQSGAGWTAVWSGPELDDDTLNLLCLARCTMKGECVVLTE